MFDLEKHGTTAATEVRAGVTTWLAMAYILFVNPAILGEAIPLGESGFAQLLTVTAVAAAFGTLLMGLWARLPFALAPGMGLNAYFAYTVVLGQGVDWRAALGAVFLSGLLFLLLSVTGIRRAIVAAIPVPLRGAIAAGIGLFLALLGLKSAELVVDHPATLVALGEVTASGPLLCLVGLVLVAGLVARKVPGAMLIGIGTVSALAIVTGAPVYQGAAFGGFPNGVLAAPVWPADLVGALDLRGAVDMGLLAVVFTFTFVDLFDTAGTLTGLAERSGLKDADGIVPRADRAFSSDALATSFGALLGTSTTTAYIESAAGVQAGGRTGLTAVVVALCFLASLFAWPLVGAVPAVATAPVLIVVGASMLDGLRGVDWDDPAQALPCLLCAAGMPLTFSIANGIALGLVSWVAVHALSGRLEKVSPVLWAIAAVVVVRYAWLAGG